MGDKLDMRGEERGYLAVVIAVVIATLLALITLHRGQSVHCQQVDKARVLSAVTDHQSKLHVSSASHLEIKKIGPAQEISEHTHAALVSLINLETGETLAKSSDKMWFDAYWRRHGNWEAPSGDLWAIGSFNLESEHQSARLIARLTPHPPPPPSLALDSAGGERLSDPRSPRLCKDQTNVGARLQYSIECSSSLDEPWSLHPQSRVCK